MKNGTVLFIATIITLFSFPDAGFGQAPNLATAADYVLFSGVGAVSNTGISQLTGNIGTNSGAISGFGNVNGVMHTADVATAQAATDLLAAWSYLANLAPTAAHGPVLGGGEILFKGVDTLAAAGSVVGVLTLDAQGDPNAVFIIKTGGALTTAASATVNLINGALACNVFWLAEGAISMATMTIMRGTLIAHNGAIDMGAGGTIEGRALSTIGAVSVYGTLAFIPIGCGSTILTGPAAPALNNLSCYALFSSNGIVSNAGITHVRGDIGTNQDVVTGFNPLLVTGSVHPIPDFSTAACAVDLQNLYTYLNTLPYDIELLYPAQFGNKLVLTPHTYLMNAAATFTDTLYLDAESNAGAIFVIQINGALSTTTFSKVALINGALAQNVYWKVEGAVTINDNSIFCGTVVSNSGAINLNTSATLNGRALTTSGVINTLAISADNSFGGFCTVLPVEMLSFTGVCDGQYAALNWTTAMEINNKAFTVERSAEGMIWEVIGMVEGAGNSSARHQYYFMDNLPLQTISYYRLKQTDFNGNNKYGIVIAVKKCEDAAVETLSIYPNPSTGKFDLLFTGDRSQVQSVKIFNSLGQNVYEAIGFQAAIDLSNKPSGCYFVQVRLNSKTTNLNILVEK